MKKDIKDIFQDSFETYSTPVDTQALLKGISAKRQQPKKKKRAILWLFPLGLCLVGASYYFASGDIRPGSVDEVVTLKTSTPISTVIKKDNNLKPTNSPSATPNIKSNIKSNNKASVINPQENKVIEDEKILNQNPEVIKITFKTKSINPTLKSPITQEVSNNLQKAQPKAIAEPQPALPESSSKPNPNAISKTTPAEASAITLLEEKQEIHKENTPKVDTPAQKKIIVINENHNPLIDTVTQTTAKTTVKTVIESMEESGSIRYKFMIGAQLPFISSGHSSSHSSLALSRAQALGQAYGYSGTGQLYYNLAHKFHIGVGLEYSRSVQLFKWSGTYFETTDGAYIDEVPKQSLTSEYLINKKEREIVNYNTSNTLDLPILISYGSKIGQRGKLTAEPYAMISFTLWQNTNGFTLDQNQIPQAINFLDIELTPTYGIGIDLEYVINEKSGLVTRMSLIKKAINDNILKEILWTPNLSIGYSRIIK